MQPSAKQVFQLLILCEPYFKDHHRFNVPCQSHDRTCVCAFEARIFPTNLPGNNELSVGLFRDTGRDLHRIKANFSAKIAVILHPTILCFKRSEDVSK